MPIATHCAYCGKPFEHSPSSKRKFCSQDCYHLSTKQRVACICQQCGQGFETLPSYIEKGGGKYCSRACFFQANSGENNPAWQGGDLELTCANCGKIFYRPRTWPISDTQYCSQECYHAFAKKENHPSWQGGVATENELARGSWELQLWKREVFARDDYTCQICGQRGGRLHAHHLKPFAEYPELRHDISNGQTLCEDCHRAIHFPNLEPIAQLQLSFFDCLS